MRTSTPCPKRPLKRKTAISPRLEVRRFGTRISMQNPTGLSRTIFYSGGKANEVLAGPQIPADGAELQSSRSPGQRVTRCDPETDGRGNAGTSRRILRLPTGANVSITPQPRSIYVGGPCEAALRRVTRHDG